MDGIGGAVKNIIFKKVKSDQLVVHSPLEVSGSVTKFVLSIHSIYLRVTENIVEPEDISMARKIDQAFKIDKLEIKFSQKGDT